MALFEDALCTKLVANEEAVLGINVLGNQASLPVLSQNMFFFLGWFNSDCNKIVFISRLYKATIAFTLTKRSGTTYISG